jgi:HTH-type transcriptional regulator/antitoxin HipB
MKTTSLDELKDRYIGLPGSSDREVFDQDLRVGIIGAQIKQIRLERNLTQAQLGELVGLKKARIAKLENSPKQARIDTILKVCVALDAKLFFSVEL